MAQTCPRCALGTAIGRPVTSRVRENGHESTPRCVEIIRILWNADSLGVEVLRRSNISRPNRVCRFCRAAIEDKCHTFLECRVNTSTACAFPRTDLGSCPSASSSISYSSLSGISRHHLDTIFKHNRLWPLVAEYVYNYNIFRVFDQSPLYVVGYPIHNLILN